MKKQLLILFYLLLNFSTAQGQAKLMGLPEQDACNALKLCGGIFQAPQSYFGGGSIGELTPVLNNYTHEHNSVWFELEVTTAGDIIFDITAGNDYYANYGFSIYDITNGNCNNLSLSNLVRFTAWIGNGATGGLRPGYATKLYASFTLNTQNFLTPISANAGDRFLICIHQYNYPARTGFTLDFSASTAGFGDASTPAFAGITPSCNQSQKISVQMSEPVVCNSIAADGSDFFITPGNFTVSAASGTLCDVAGYSRNIDINFSAPLPPGQYQLHIQNGTDGNRLADLCGNEQIPDDSLSFIVAPYSPLQFEATNNGGCRQTKIYFSHPVRAGSVAPDGSDFWVSGPSLLNIEKAIPLGCNSSRDFTDSVLLIFEKPATANGIYSIKIKEGIDGNTVADSCGQELLSSDSINFSVNTYAPIIVTHDTVLCNAESLQLAALSSALPPFNDTCSTNYAANPAALRDVQSDPVQNSGGGVPWGTLAAISPFLKTYSDIKLQYIFHHEELTAMGLRPGVITELSWFVTSDRLIPTPFHNFTLKLGCTDEDSFSNDYIPGTQMVFSTSSFDVFDQGWIKIKFQIPFAWLDSQKNLVIETCFDNTDLGGIGEFALVALKEQNFTASYLRYGDNLTGCAMSNKQGRLLRSIERPITRFGYLPPPDTGLKYLWSPGEGLNDSTIADPVADIRGNITYTVSTADNFGCYFQDTVSVSVSSYTGVIFPSDTTICRGDEISLKASGGETFAWATTMPPLSCSNCPDPRAKPEQPTIYTAWITDEFGCTDTAQALVSIFPDILVKAFPVDTLVKFGAQIQLFAETENASAYFWNPVADLNTPFIKAPVVTVYEPVDYIVKVTNEHGCTASDTLHINVDFRDKIFIPSAFSPNGDGHNDLFRVGHVSFQKITEFSIFNRWGNKVFSGNNARPEWDGSFGGSPQPAGTYYYIIRVAYPDGYSEMYKGDVTLLR